MLALFGWCSDARAASLSSGAPADSFDMTEFAIDLAQPTDIAILPDGRAVITQRNGDVVVIASDGTPIDAGHVEVDSGPDEQGLLGVVADPSFQSNHTLYFYASAGGDAANKHQVQKIALGDDSQLSSDRPAIVDMGLRGPANHNGGGLFIHKRQLYISVGDTGGNATPPTNRFGTCLNVANGSILRVNLDGSVPDDNPLVGMDRVTGCMARTADLEDLPPDTRIFTWGLRNPWRFWVDPQTDLLWIGDVGERAREEVTVGGKGTHHGWPFWEGLIEYSQSDQPWRPANECQGITPPRDCTAPVYDYPHSQSNASITGGLIPPRGCGWDAPWSDRYFFGDYNSGRVWTLDVTSDRRSVVDDSRQDFASTGGIVSFRMGADGALYLVEVTAGSVQRVTPKGVDAGACPPPVDTPDASVGTDAGAPAPDASAPSAGGAAGGGGRAGASGGANPGSGGSAGEGGTTAGGANGTGAAAGMPAAGASPDSGVTAPAAESDSGCSCRTASATSGLGARFGWLAAMAIALLGRRRQGPRAR